MPNSPSFYRDAFEHEISANKAMLTMLDSVPAERRADPLFQRAVDIATHMAECRSSFLDVITGKTTEIGGSMKEGGSLNALNSNFEAMESTWKDYLSAVKESDLAGFFYFVDGGERWGISLDAQLFQLVGHAAYHRGQVVILVNLLGGETFDTDYIEWFTANHPEGWSQG